MEFRGLISLALAVGLIVIFANRRSHPWESTRSADDQDHA
jgi:hypothetical protein